MTHFQKFAAGGVLATALALIGVNYDTLGPSSTDPDGSPRVQSAATQADVPVSDTTGERRPTGRLRVQACNDKTCLRPSTVRASLPVPFIGSLGTADQN